MGGFHGTVNHDISVVFLQVPISNPLDDNYCFIIDTWGWHAKDELI
jgi:hypothetical protein